MLGDINFRFKHLANTKSKDIEFYQVKILKIGGHILIPHIHKLFNLVVKQGFPTPWTKILIIHIFKSGYKNDPSNYQTIMISHHKAKLCKFFFKAQLGLNNIFNLFTEITTHELL